MTVFACPTYGIGNEIVRQAYINTDFCVFVEEVKRRDVHEGVECRCHMLGGAIQTASGDDAKKILSWYARQVKAEDTKKTRE